MVLGTQPGGCCRKRRGWAVPQPKHHVGSRCLGKPPGRCRPSARLSLLRALQGLAGGSPSRQTSEFSASGMTMRPLCSALCRVWLAGRSRRSGGAAVSMFICE